MLMHDVKLTAKLIAQQLLQSRPAVQVAAATVLANWSYLLLVRSEKISELGPREDLMRIIIEIFGNETSFGGRSEMALLRFMQAIVTLMWGDGLVIKTSKDRGLAVIVNRIKDAVQDENGKAIARDIIEMLNAA